ncbi:coiled-coil domain-containing protein 63 [Aquila chrysaetos chrysaetos]|uniref:coiled-coil domain-containing protein 63 n=1 Tax=Aquila chrysaetos chrysaetos TaxID=223781 RepID=UPI0005D0A686|nr:coiled-coil domain-containing protein 63 [Aquila chrysaetos chrysaetos]
MGVDYPGAKHLVHFALKLMELRGGPSLRQKLSEFPVKEKEKLAEAEIRRLQKQFRIAVQKRKSYGANMKQQMQAQEKEIESLTQEHKEVSLTLSQITSLRNAMLDDRNCMELQCLLQTKYQYDSLIRDRKALLADLDNQILELEKKIVRQNQIAVKVKQANCSKRLQKQIETLEMRLNNVTVHFDTILTRNNKLREEIENLRIQKAILDNFYLKLHKKLDQQRRRMNTAVEQTAQAYEQRMEALARISAMNERHSKDTVQYNVELQEQERVLDQETKLKTFVLAKFTDRSELEEEAKKKKALKVAQRAKRSQGESFESQEVAYKRLLELAEDGDIDRLVNGFIEKEEKNFACFSYATELNNEMEKMQRRIKDLQNEIMALMMDQEDAENSSLHVLKELEEKLMETTEEANRYEDKCKESSKILGQLKTDMEVLFKEINCDATKIMKQLGENGQITDLNLMQFFGLVEKKTNELLLMESILRYTSADDSHPAQPFTNPLLDGTSLLRPMDRAQLCPPPPTLDSTTDAIDAWEVPLDHGQLRQLILQSCEKELGNATGMGKKGRNGVKV